MKLLKSLCETYGPTGREDRIRSIIKKEIKDFVDSVSVDAMGNLIGHCSGRGDKIMVSAHMDEIGLIASYVDEKGFIRFSALGGVNPNRLVAMRVIFENGTIGVIHHETKNQTESGMKFEKLYIDIGASDRKTAATRIKVGDIAAFLQNVQTVGNRVVAKALDDRIGCYVLIETIKKLRAKRKHPDLYFVFTVQEEIGLRGATTSTYGIAPDYGLAVDVTGTGDTPESEKMAVQVGKGPAIKVKDRGMISHPAIKDRLIALARRNRIPYQLEILEWGTTDAAVMQLSRAGVPSGTLSIPARYIHTTSEMVDLSDVNNTIKLMTEFLGSGIK